MKGLKRLASALVMLMLVPVLFISAVLGLLGGGSGGAEEPGIGVVGCGSGELEAIALTHPNLSWRPEARGDVAAGKIDPRVLYVLVVMAERHKLGPIGPLITGHSYYVRGTNSPSNHAFGRAVDIAVIDGQAVSVANPNAKEVMEAILKLPDWLLPDELGGPWDIPNEKLSIILKDHGDHLHMGWDHDLPEDTDG